MWQTFIAGIAFGFIGGSVGYMLAKIRNSIDKIEYKFMPINSQLDIYLPAIDRQIMELRSEVEYLKTMLQFQQIRESQKDKTQEETKE
jgi:hypothetical protein